MRDWLTSREATRYPGVVDDLRKSQSKMDAAHDRINSLERKVKDYDVRIAKLQADYQDLLRKLKVRFTEVEAKVEEQKPKTSTDGERNGTPKEGVSGDA